MGSTMVASSKNIFGPYSKRYVLLSDAWGHSRPFQDEKGKWWTAMWMWSGEWYEEMFIRN
jgi:FtsP/CotA-like multicopper oxidase with cupredoxin domain